MGYRSPLGAVDEGSDIFLSTIGCLVDSGMEGFPALITLETVAAVEKLILCIGSNV